MFRIPIGEKALLSLGVLAVILIGLISYRMIDGIELKDDTLVIAHRGASMTAPENTMAAIKNAVDAGADWVEIDVQETADGKVVVFHDSDFKRVGGKSLTIWDAQSDQLPGIDIGSWFDPTFSKETTPSLLDVLEVCRDKSGVLIELKYYGHDQNLEQRVIEIFVWTVNDPIDISTMTSRGVDGLITDTPDTAFSVLAQRKKLKPSERLMLELAHIFGKRSRNLEQ